MKSKRTFYGLSSAAALATVLVFSVAVAGQLDQPVTASSSYTLTFNASNGAFSNSTSSSSLYQNTDARTSSGAAIAVNYYQAKAASSYYAELSSGGYLYVPNGLTGLTSITVNFVDRGSGGLSLYASDCPSFQGSATALTSGTPVSLHFNYFKLLAPSGVVDVVSIVCKYTCQTATNSSTQSTTNYLYFHYHRSDATYTLNSKAYGTWVWTSGSGTQYAFDQSDSYGVYWALPLSTWGTTTTLNYIVHPAGDWDNKDPGGDEVFSLSDFTADANGNYSVYKLSGKSGVYASSVLAMAASSETTPTTPSDGNDKGLILHCFDWSLATIESNLDAIAAAGYTAIQTSPMQQCKDYSASWTDTSGQWWKLYQPIAFSIATSSWIGTTSTLTSLCTAAKAKGIKIIVDVVANHMAGGSSSNTPDSQVATYESYIYNNQSSTFHTYKAADWNDTSTYTITHENICCPDLNTANAYVQSRVLSYLKSCIDCGVSGFRFDAAKHIELPSDGTSASDFWTNTAVAAKTYATSKGITLFNYGEVLDSPGSSRSRADYDNYLDALTDNSVGYNVLSGVYNTNASTSSSPSYNSNQAASKTVLWAESHDTYLNSGGFSSGATQDQIDLAWGVVAARANAHCLYFVRPGSTMNSTLNTAYLSDRVKAINSFHNAMISATSEYLSNDSYHLVGVERSDGSSLFGMSIIDVSGYSGSLSMTTHLIANGTYTDLYSGNTFTVSNNRVSGTMSNGVACLIQA